MRDDNLARLVEELLMESSGQMGQMDLLRRSRKHAPEEGPSPVPL